MIGAIVLAAGESRRMGVQKLMLPYGGATVIEHIVDQLIKIALDEIHVVVGQAGDRIAEQLSGREVGIVTNPDYQKGMLSSVRCGLGALAPNCEWVLVALGDQPAITFELVNEMVLSTASTEKGIIAPFYRGRRGHPLLFSGRYRPEVMTRFDDVGLRGLLRVHRQDVFELKVTTAAVLSDMDYPEDYRRELTRLNPSGK
jgi:molybdenum cofactor cytidylyltransferase